MWWLNFRLATLGLLGFFGLPLSPSIIPSTRAAADSASLIFLATRANLWQAIPMGNKDRGKRETKKPKKVVPKLPPARRDAGPIPTHVIKKIGE